MANCYCTRSSVDLCDHCTETFSQGWDSGKAQERERIIALLEGDIVICKEFGHQDNDADCDAGCDAVRHCIALIKGEIE